MTGASTNTEHRMRLPTISLAAALAAFASVGVAEAKTCKEPITVSSRSTVQGGESARASRATSNAQKKWSKEARAKYGFQYQFWLRADAKSTDCHPTPKSSVCKVTATPCSLF